MHAQLTRPESQQVTENRQRARDRRLKQRLARTLQQSPYPQVRRVELDVDNERVILHGSVGSFYLKQHAQTAIMRVAGIESLENRIEVCSPSTENSRNQQIASSESIRTETAMPATMELTERSLQGIRYVRSVTSPDTERETGEALDKATIAELPYSQVEHMTHGELIRVIRASELPLLGSQLDRRLDYLDRPTLLRGAHLARRCCRNQGY